MRPDYAGGSLVNLVATLVAACGGKALHAPLRDFAIDARARNVVLLIIDGLGDNYLARHGAGSELARRRRRSLTSVFPSTTASAITTSYTGRTPLEHGLTGWFVYFGAAGCVSAALPFRSRGDMTSLTARGVSAERIFDTPPLFASLAVKSIVVTYREIVDSHYNRVHCRGAERVAYDNADDFITQLEHAVKSGPERKFIYAYWPHYDAFSHRHGCESAEAATQFAIIDAAFGKLLQRLAGSESTVIASADHGFIDVAPEESLELPAELAPHLRFPLCGERRWLHIGNHGGTHEDEMLVPLIVEDA